MAPTYAVGALSSSSYLSRLTSGSAEDKPEEKDLGCSVHYDPEQDEEGDDAADDEKCLLALEKGVFDDYFVAEHFRRI